jgi:hypothetical protein
MTYMGNRYYPLWLDNLADDDARAIYRHSPCEALGRHTLRSEHE